MTERVPAVGGERLIPAPDPFARDYLLLALRLDQRLPGLVDAYFGPAALKAQVDTEQLRSPARLRDDAAQLLERLASDVEGDARRRWLRAQLVALEAHARSLADDPLPYLEHVERCFDFRPERVPDAVFADAAAELDRLLPRVPGGAGGGAATIVERVAAWDATFTIEPDRLRGVLAWLIGRFRDRTRSLFGLPDGERVVVSFVTGQPWSGYNWYDGNGRSRVDINTDLPVRAADLVQLAAHEAYPGHHTEHAWKDRLLVDERGHTEASVQLINVPECLISEGLADLGRRFVAADPDLPDLLVELYERAGLPIAADSGAARDAALRQVEIRRALDAVRGVAGNAALLLHADGLARDDVRAYLHRYLLTTPDRADKRLSFIEHPLWRTYVFVYFEGERLLRRWIERLPAGEQPERFARLLREPLTPGAIVEELA